MRWSSEFVYGRFVIDWDAVGFHLLILSSVIGSRGLEGALVIGGVRRE